MVRASRWVGMKGDSDSGGGKGAVCKASIFLPAWYRYNNKKISIGQEESRVTYCTVNNPSPNPPIHRSVSLSPSSFEECAPACSNAISFSLYLCAVPACAIFPSIAWASTTLEVGGGSAAWDEDW